MSQYESFNPYEILGVEFDATVEEIKKAYKRKAQKVHPDVCDDIDSVDKFQNLKEAYSILKDGVRRKAFDEDGVYAKIDSIDVEASNLLLTLIDTTFDELLKVEGDFELDFKEVIKIKLKAAEVDLNKGIESIGRLDRVIELLENGLQYNGEGVDFFDAIFRQRIKKNKLQRQLKERGIAVIARMLDLVAQYSYEGNVLLEREGSNPQGYVFNYGINSGTTNAY